MKNSPPFLREPDPEIFIPNCNKLLPLVLQWHLIFVIFSLVLKIFFSEIFPHLKKIHFLLPRGPDSQNSLYRLLINFQQSDWNETWYMWNSNYSSGVCFENFQFFEKVYNSFTSPVDRTQKFLSLNFQSASNETWSMWSCNYLLRGVFFGYFFMFRKINI